MKLYIGSRALKPEGYKTVDLDPGYQPDFLTDASDLSCIPSGSTQEVYASAILEHMSWPKGYLALSEWARVLETGGVLKVSVPDMKLLCSLVAQGVNPSHCIGMIYGTERWSNPLEAHQYGFTRETLTEMLHVLGFGEFDTWESDLGDASSGWLYLVNGEQVAVSLNIRATKIRPPLVETTQLLPALQRDLLAPFMAAVREAAGQSALPALDADIVATTQQRLLFKLIDANQRIEHLEGQLQRARRRSVSARFKSMKRRIKSMMG